MSTYIWNGYRGPLPAKVQGREGDELIIRVPDPYDPGEVEIRVHESEVERVS